MLCNKIDHSYVIGGKKTIEHWGITHRSNKVRILQTFVTGREEGIVRSVIMGVKTAQNTAINLGSKFIRILWQRLYVFTTNRAIIVPMLWKNIFGSIASWTCAPSMSIPYLRYIICACIRRTFLLQLYCFHVLCCWNLRYVEMMSNYIKCRISCPGFLVRQVWTPYAAFPLHIFYTKCYSIHLETILKCWYLCMRGLHSAGTRY